MKHVYLAIGFVLGCITLSACNSSTSSSSADTLTILGSIDATGESASLSPKTMKADLDLATAGSPTSLSVDLYQIYVGASADCTDLTLIQDNGDAPETFDFVASPTLFSGEVVADTYNCFVMVLSDNMVLIPDATAEAAFPGVCVEGTEYTFDVYREDSDETAWKDIDGNDVIGQGTADAPVANTITFFASTDPTAAMAALGLGENQVGTLSGGLTVPGQTTFFADFSNSLADNDGHCWSEGGALGFR